MQSSSERERLRTLHRAQLAAVRQRATADRIRRLERAHGRAQRNLVVLATAFVGLVTLGAAAQDSVIDAVSPFFSSLRAKEATIDELTVGRAIRIVDEAGRELAVLGREGDEPNGRDPVVLGLNAHTTGGPAQTLRLAASPSGSAVSLRTPDDRSAVALMAGASGPEIVLVEGSTRRMLTELTELTERRGGLPGVAAARVDVPPAVDLTQAGVQDIGHGFLAVQLAVTEAAEGARVSGRIINTTAVRHKRLDFRLSAAGRVEPFRITRISPGNSTGFAVTLPGVAASELGRAHIEYVGSTVAYYGHSLDGYDGPWISAR